MSRRCLVICCHFLMLQIDFGRDFERQLDSYVDARSSFSNLESVRVMLVQVVADKQLSFDYCAWRFPGD